MAGEAGASAGVTGTIPSPRRGPNWTWYVRHGGPPAYGDLVSLPFGQKPLEANWGAAVYVGNTAKQVNANIKNAAKRLGLPDPTKTPSWQDTLAIVGAELAGAGVAVAGAGAAVGDAAAGGEGAVASGSGAAGAATAAKTAGSAVSDVKSLAAGATIAGLLSDPTWLFRAAKFVGGLILAILGLLQLARAGGAGVGKASAVTVGAS